MPTLLHFRLLFKESGCYPVRVKLVAQNLYDTVSADTTVCVQRPGEDCGSSDAQPATEHQDATGDPTRALPSAVEPLPPPVPQAPENGLAPPDSLQGKLERTRQDGVKLLGGLRNPLHGYALYGRRFEGEDVSAWIAEVRDLLRDYPEYVALFHREPPIDQAVTLLAMATGEHNVRRLQRRLRQLDKVIERL